MGERKRSGEGIEHKEEEKREQKEIVKQTEEVVCLAEMGKEKMPNLQDVWEWVTKEDLWIGQ